MNNTHFGLPRIAEHQQLQQLNPNAIAFAPPVSPTHALGVRQSQYMLPTQAQVQIQAQAQQMQALQQQQMQARISQQQQQMQVDQYVLNAFAVQHQQQQTSMQLALLQQQQQQQAWAQQSGQLQAQTQQPHRRIVVADTQGRVLAQQARGGAPLFTPNQQLTPHQQMQMQRYGVPPSVQELIIYNMHQRGYHKNHPLFLPYMNRAKNWYLIKQYRETKCVEAQCRACFEAGSICSKCCAQYLRYRQEEQRQNVAKEQQRKQLPAQEQKESQCLQVAKSSPRNRY